MDSHSLLVEVTDSSFLSSTALDSPNLSSGYCSSEDSHTFETNVRNVRDMYAKHIPGTGRLAFDNTLTTSKSPYRAVLTKYERTELHEVAESLFNPFTETDTLPRKFSSPIPRNAGMHMHMPQNVNQSFLGQTISQFSQHLSAELSESSLFLADNGSLQYTSESIESFPHYGSCIVSRSQCANATLPNSVMRPLYRTRGGATLASCSKLLCHSASVPNKISVVSGQRGSGSSGSQKNVSSKCRTVLNRQSSRVAVPTCDALRDHMYAMRPVALSNNESVWTKKSASSQERGSTANISSNKTKNMSILEAFLRSTTARFDANRGSTRLAAEEFAKLHVSPDLYHCDISEAMADDDTESAPSPQSSLLKQLLTGEVCSSELEKGRVSEDRLQMCLPEYSVDSLLTDGFGLDANLQLDDPLSNGIGLLGDKNEMIVINANNSQTVLTCDLDDSIQEQSRQESLLWQHYIKGLV